MTNPRTILRLAALAGGITAIAFGGEVNGTLLSTMCAAKASKGGPEAVARHERTCNLKPDCAKTGFGVLTADNKFYSFDEAGNAKALKALQESTKKDDMKVVVTGDVEGSKITVSTLKLLE